MVTLTARKVRRMGLSLRQIDVVRAVGISPARFSQIENELIEPNETERALIDAFFSKVARELETKGQSPQSRQMVGASPL